MNASHGQRFVPALLCILAAVLAGCSGGRTLMTTRSETESHHQVLVREQSRSEPAGAEFGVLKPSRKQTIVDRTTIEYDSVCTRYYPAFARYGAFEVGGLIAGFHSDDRKTIGNGLLGVYNSFGPPDTRHGATFNGYLFRIGMWEGRLPFLGKDWTGGTTLVEGIFGDAENGHQLIGMLPIYVKKRYFLTDTPPYLILQPFAGASLFGPYRYLNLGAALTLGSYGGANIHLQTGIAIGGPNGSDADPHPTRTIPYAGLGLSVLDFLNTEREMDTEWKHHEIQARRMGLFHLTLLQSSIGSTDGVVLNGKGSSDRQIFTDFDGFILQVASVAFPLRWLPEEMTVGTTVINMMYLGRLEVGVGILPLRATYQYRPWPKILIEPFLEFNYYPSSVLHAGARFNVGDFAGLNIGLQAGAMYGNSGQLTRNIFESFTSDVKGIYAGFTLGLFDFYSSPVVDGFRDVKDCRTPFGEY